MKIKALIAFVMFTGVLFGQTTTYTGTVKDLSGSVVTSGNVTFTLTPSVDTTISGTSRFTPNTVNCTINGSGALVANDGVSACVVTQNTALTPTGTSYTICIQPYFTSPGSCFVDYAVTSSKDISTVAPTPQLSPNYPITGVLFGTQNTWTAAQTHNAPVIFNSTTAGYEVWTGDFLVSNLFNIVLNPSVNSTANQFGLQAQMYDLTANSNTYSGQQQAVYGSYSHMGSGSATAILGGAFEGFNAGAGTTTTVYGVSGNAYCGGVAIAVESGTAQQNPTNNGNCTNLRGASGTVFNLSSGTVAVADGLYVGTPTNSNGGTITNLHGLHIADQTLGANNWAIQTGLGKVQFGDNLQLDKLFSMGTVASASAGMFIQPSTMTGTTQFGARVLPTTSSAATTFGIGVYGRADTSAAAYTQADNAGLYAANPTKGSGSAITRSYGLYIESITSGGTNWAIKTNGTAVSEFDGGVNLGASDTGLSRGAAGQVNVGNGTAGDASGKIVAGSAQIGATGVTFSKLARYTATLSPASVAANTTAVQTFTITGVATGDTCVTASKPTAQAGLGIVGCYNGGTNTIGIVFSNNTASPITPTASELYAVVVLQ